MKMCILFWIKYLQKCALFPFEYIHVGGDECAKNFLGKK